VWDAQTGEVTQDLLPDSSSATVEFSPDGKWLVTGTAQEFGFIEVGSWRVHHRIARDRAGNAPGHIAFTRDGRMAAITHSRTLVSLIDPHTGRQLAALEPPNPDALGWLCFTPDGSHLAADAGNTIHLWDLRRIREQLAALGLDWDLPSYAAADQQTATPLEVAVEMGALTGSRP
jgi:WD40 repeat protein